MRPRKILWGGVESIAVWDNGQLRNISLDYLKRALGVTSCWRTYSFERAGWHRIASIGTVGSTCTISIKRLYSTVNDEAHKVELIKIHQKAAFKSIYDLVNMLLIDKIRCVITSQEAHIDIHYAEDYRNTLSISLLDAINQQGDIWKLNNDVIVPETADGETVLAEMDFGENTLTGQPL